MAPLCSFVAQGTGELVWDDGGETTRAFVLKGMLDSGLFLPEVCVPSCRFGSMAWVTGGWGLSPVVRAGWATRDQLREAIHVLSPDPQRPQIFTHTGWREHDGHWIYLAAAGVGSEGFEVGLGLLLDRYRLPRVAENRAETMKVNLQLLELAPLTVAATLWAGIFRAPSQRPPRPRRRAGGDPYACEVARHPQSDALTLHPCRYRGG